MRIKNVWKSEVKLYDLEISLSPGEISRELTEREVEMKAVQQMIVAGWLVVTGEKPIVYGTMPSGTPSEPRPVSASGTVSTVETEREPLLAAQQPKEEESTIIVPGEEPGEGQEKTISEMATDASAKLKETLSEKETKVEEEPTKEDLLWQSKHFATKKSAISAETDTVKLERILRIDKNENVKRLCQQRLNELKGI